VLRRNNLPFTDNVSPLLIVVPVYERAGARQLWETPNPWDSAWRARIGAQGLVRIVMADGNPSEQLVVSADQAVAGDADRLRALAQSYGARGALVAHAEFQINPRNGQPYLETSLTGYGVAPPGPLERTFAGQAGLAGGADQAAASLAETATAGLWDMLAEAWKAQNVSSGGPGGDAILAAYAVTHLGDYAAMLRQLREIPSVDHTTVASLTAREIVFRLSLSGSPAQAQSTFSQYGLSLTDSGDGRWVLTNGG
jgi:hypothetical protein